MKTLQVNNSIKTNSHDSLKCSYFLIQLLNKQFFQDQRDISSFEFRVFRVPQAISNHGELQLINLNNSKPLLYNQGQIQQYPKTLTFSNTYKGPGCQVSEGGKVVECSGGTWYYCLCEQAIPKTGKTLFAFQMLSGTYFYVGIGFRDIIQQKNYQYAGVGYGSYVISYDGYTFSHHNKDVDSKQLSFTFKTNDIIIMEVSIEHKYIKWTRQNNPLATVLEIDTSISQELYPCVYVYILINQDIISQNFLCYNNNDFYKQHSLKPTRNDVSFSLYNWGILVIIQDAFSNKDFYQSQFIQICIFQEDKIMQLQAKLPKFQIAQQDLLSCKFQVYSQNEPLILDKQWHQINFFNIQSIKIYRLYYQLVQKL